VADCFPDCVHSQEERAQLQREHDETMQRILVPDPTLSEPGPSKPPLTPNPNSCHQECTKAYPVTFVGGVVTLAEIALG
jgi:hypothetical protein